MSQATISIDITALRHNFQQIKTIAGGRSVIAMIKANAYGHGIEHIATSLPQADAFGVASLGEGILIRSAGVTQAVVLMQGIIDADELTRAIMQKFSLVIHQMEQVNILKRLQKIAEPITVWLKIDTGMNRLGFEPQEALTAYQELMKCDAVKKPIGIMTHLAEADNLSSRKTVDQLSIFERIAGDLPGPRSIANSAGILGWPTAHADWVRPGIILYGVSPFAGTCGSDYHLRPVMTLSTYLLAIQRVSKGERIGYSGTWTAPEDMLMGVAGLGYADGYPQFAKSGTPVLIGNTICPLVGRVSMDMITVNLNHHPHPKIGDPVVLWGNQLPIETIATHCDTSPYELLCRVTTRARMKTINYAES